MCESDRAYATPTAQSTCSVGTLIVQTHERLDWDRIAVTARSFDRLAVLRAAVDRLARCWPSLPLGEPRRALQARTPSQTDARLSRLLTAESRNNVLDGYTTLVSLPGLGDRARFVWTYVFPDAAYMRYRYGAEAGWQLP